MTAEKENGTMKVVFFVVLFEDGRKECLCRTELIQ